MRVFFWKKCQCSHIPDQKKGDAYIYWERNACQICFVMHLCSNSVSILLWVNREKSVTTKEHNAYTLPLKNNGPLKYKLSLNDEQHWPQNHNCAQDSKVSKWKSFRWDMGDHASPKEWTSVFSTMDKLSQGRLMMKPASFVKKERKHHTHIFLIVSWSSESGSVLLNAQACMWSLILSL